MTSSKKKGNFCNVVFKRVATPVLYLSYMHINHLIDNCSIYISKGVYLPLCCVWTVDI